MQDKFGPDLKFNNIPLRWPLVYLITDDSGRSPANLADVISRAILGGVNCVQFREKSLSHGQTNDAFAAIAETCASLDTPLLLNGDLIDNVDIRIPFSGFHCNQHTIPGEQLPAGGYFGYSAHSPGEASIAFDQGAEFCTISPIYPTPSKAGILDPIGLAGLTAATQSLSSRRLVALGGINTSNAKAVMQAGASGIAVIREIWNAEDPTVAARQLRIMIENCANPMNNLSSETL